MKLLTPLLISVPLGVAPDAALPRNAQRPVRLIRFEHPAGFSIPDALVGVAAAGLLIGLVALLFARCARNQPPTRRSSP